MSRPVTPTPGMADKRVSMGRLTNYVVG
jgi:hypothetical protein